MTGKNCVLSSGQDGGVGRNASLPCTTKRRTTNLKTIAQPKVSENQTAWKSENQGLIQTFTQTSRWGRDGQLNGKEGCLAQMNT